MKLFKNEKEKTTEERIRKARRDTHQAIYIALASIGTYKDYCILRAMAYRMGLKITGVKDIKSGKEWSR